jgi:hypothetical protein
LSNCLLTSSLLNKLGLAWPQSAILILSSVLQIPLALWVMGTPEVNANRLLAKTPASMLMLSISAGYFLYDAAVSILRYEGIAYLMHGVVACVLYTYGALTGFLSYYGAAATSAAGPCSAMA